MKKFFLSILILVCISTVHATRYYYTQQNGDPAVASTWVVGNNPAVPNFSDTANRIFVSHILTATSTGNFSVKCYVKIEMSGILIFNYQTHITGANCRIDVWGTFNIYNVLYMENASHMYIYYGGFVYTNNKIDVLGNGNTESGHIILWGGGICWRTLWKGLYPPEGYGTICNSPIAAADGCCISTGPLGISLVSFDTYCKGSTAVI
jgi:hypothetical protein